MRNLGTYGRLLILSIFCVVSARAMPWKFFGGPSSAHDAKLIWAGADVLLVKQRDLYRWSAPTSAWQQLLALPPAQSLLESVVVVSEQHLLFYGLPVRDRRPALYIADLQAPERGWSVVPLPLALRPWYKLPPRVSCWFNRTPIFSVDGQHAWRLNVAQQTWEDIQFPPSIRGSVTCEQLTTEHLWFSSAGKRGASYAINSGTWQVPPPLDGTFGVLRDETGALWSMADPDGHGLAVYHWRDGQPSWRTVLPSITLPQQDFPQRFTLDRDALVINGYEGQRIRVDSAGGIRPLPARSRGSKPSEPEVFQVAQALDIRGNQDTNPYHIADSLSSQGRWAVTSAGEVYRCANAACAKRWTPVNLGLPLAAVDVLWSAGDRVYAHCAGCDEYGQTYVWDRQRWQMVEFLHYTPWWRQLMSLDVLALQADAQQKRPALKMLGDAHLGTALAHINGLGKQWKDTPRAELPWPFQITDARLSWWNNTLWFGTGKGVLPDNAVVPDRRYDHAAVMQQMSPHVLGGRDAPVTALSTLDKKLVAAFGREVARWNSRAWESLGTVPGPNDISQLLGGAAGYYAATANSHARDAAPRWWWRSAQATEWTDITAGLPDKSPQSAAADGEMLWVAVHDEGLFHFTPNRGWHRMPTPEGRSVRSITLHRGELWLGTDKGIYTVDPHAL